MPDITLNFTLTTTQDEKVRRWFTRMNASLDSPFSTLEDYLEAMVTDHVQAGIAAQGPFDIQGVWESLTDAQKDQIKAIAGVA